MMGGGPMGGGMMGGMGMTPGGGPPGDPCGGFGGGPSLMGGPDIGGLSGLPGVTSIDGTGIIPMNGTDTSGLGGMSGGPGGGMRMGGMGGGPPGGGGGMMGGRGTATTLSANLNYSSIRCFSVMGGVSLSLPQASSSQDFGASGSSVNLMGMANYSPSRIVGLSFTISSNLPMDGGTQAGTSAQPGPTGETSAVTPTRGAMTLLMPSVSVRPADELQLRTSLSHMINYGGVDQSFGVNGPRIPGSPTGGFGNGAGDLLQDTTTLTTSANYSLSRNLMLLASVPVGFTSGLLDPNGGFNFLVQLRKDRSSTTNLRGGIQASLPLSARSQQQGLATTVTASLGPSLANDIATFSFNSQLSYSFYVDGYVATESPATTTSQFPGVDTSASSAPESMRTLNSISFNLRISSKFSTFSSASINFLKRRDETISWGTQATPVGITYAPGTFSFSGYFSLASDPSQDQVVIFPQQSMIGGSISVRFGNAPPPFPRRLNASESSTTKMRSPASYPRLQSESNSTEESYVEIEQEDYD